MSRIWSRTAMKRKMQNIRSQRLPDHAEETAGESGQPHMKVQRYQFPPLSLLNQASSKQGGSQDRENKATALRLQQTYRILGSR